MSSTELENLIEQVKRLTPDERSHIMAAISSVTPLKQRTAEDELNLRLLRDGLIDHIPQRPADPKSYDDWKPVAVKGKPVSETIIEERR